MSETNTATPLPPVQPAPESDPVAASVLAPVPDAMKAATQDGNFEPLNSPPAPRVSPIPPTGAEVAAALLALHPETLKAALAILTPPAPAILPAPLTPPTSLTEKQLAANALEAHLAHKGPQSVPGFCE